MGTVYIAEVLKPLATLFVIGGKLMDWVARVKEVTRINIFVETNAWGVDVNVKTGKVQALVECHYQDLVPEDLWAACDAEKGFTPENRERILKWIERLVIPSREALHVSHDFDAFADAVKRLHAHVAASHEWVAANFGEKFLTFTMGVLRNSTWLLAHDFADKGLCLS